MYSDQVASIMVTYNPESDISSNVKSISQSCRHLLIIDNGSNQAAMKNLQHIQNIDNITIIYNDKNMGLRYALNQGIHFIIETQGLMDVEWIATFDQDSCIQSNFFSTMLETYHSAVNNVKNAAAILAPNWFEEKLYAKKQLQKTELKELREQKTVITSGSLVKKSVFQKIGLFEEEYFIDFLDIEFCLRARSYGYKIYLIPNVTMLHHLGHTEEHKLPCALVKATNHNYIRRYYIT
ncbi:glycosyltransferase family 2 protein, partial [Bacillaceae bacterium Marseille-Q3522]|nr:glycosyltransferase family 2 protein [Bacillaceae bacterium Marseille-Q3522]